MKLPQNSKMRLAAKIVVLLISLSFVERAIADDQENKIKSSDTTEALSVVSNASARRDLHLLMCSFDGENVDVQLAALQAIEKLDVPSQRTAMSQILQKESLWKKSYVGGEAATIKDTFVYEVKQVTSKLGNSADSVNLYSFSDRSKLLSKISQQN